MASMFVWSGRVLLLAAVAALSACSSGASVPGLGDTDLSPGAVLSGGRDRAAEQKSAADYAPIAICPEIQVRDGTQLFRVFERGKQDDLSAVRFQAAIHKFARECRTDLSGATTIKIGVAGRVLSGPSGATGEVSLPLRVVLVHNGDEVLYSQLFKVPASITTATPSVAWNQIVDGVTIPPGPTGSYLIYVGFDESPAAKRS